MELSTVFVFNIDINSLIQRICGRLIHPGSGRIYHETFSPPNVMGKDDITGEDLVKRPDDTEENVRKRFQLYQEVTAPLIEYYNR
jgi:adenylate kinase